MTKKSSKQIPDDTWEEWEKTHVFDYIDLNTWDNSHQRGGFILHWGITGIGFGTLTFAHRDGKIVCDNETMSERFCRIVLEQFLKQTYFVNEVKDHKLTIEEEESG
jgi:hypothetical protein